MSSELMEKYRKEIVPALMKDLDKKSRFAVPKLEKVVVSICLGVDTKDAAIVQNAEKNIEAITGQKPIRTQAKISISNFKIRKGMFLGLKVTLRKDRMYDFIDRLINISLPRSRDFKGIDPKSIDNQGNLSIGFKDQIAFAEVGVGGVELLHGLEITIVTGAKSKEEGLALFKHLGLPMQKSNKK